MWITDRLGLALWRDDHSAWYFDARGGEFGIGVFATSDDTDTPVASPARLFRFSPVDQNLLPAAGEQFVCGNRWTVNYPQGEGAYALRVAFEPIQAAPDRMVLEVTISIQTDLLDVHPQLDLEVQGDSIDSLLPADQPASDPGETIGSAPISLARSAERFIGVLLGPHDSPFTSNHSSSSQLRLRLFGEFLEKGVIRKARPWIVIDQGGASPDPQELEQRWRQLCASPLPLTP